MAMKNQPITDVNRKNSVQKRSQNKDYVDLKSRLDALYESMLKPLSGELLSSQNVNNTDNMVGIKAKSAIKKQKTTKTAAKSVRKTPKSMKKVKFAPMSSFKCLNCSLEYRSKSGYKNHKCRSIDSNKDEKISLKPKATESAELKQVNKKSFQCKKCFERFEHRCGLIRHEKQAKCKAKDYRSLSSLLDDLYQEIFQR